MYVYFQMNAIAEKSEDIKVNDVCDEIQVQKW